MEDMTIVTHAWEKISHHSMMVKLIGDYYSWNSLHPQSRHAVEDMPHEFLNEVACSRVGHRRRYRIDFSHEWYWENYVEKDRLADAQAVGGRELDVLEARSYAGSPSSTLREGSEESVDGFEDEYLMQNAY